MKKLLGTTLAVALLVPASANAELLKNLKLGGSLEAEGISANNVKDLSTPKYDNISTVLTRLMVKADWDLLDDVHAHVSIDKNDRTWGGAAAGTTGTTGGNGGNSQNLNTVQTQLFVDEAYVKIDKLFGALDTTVGRQFYGEAGDLVIYYGPKYNLFGLPITTLDAGRFDWNGEKVGVTLLAGKVTGIVAPATLGANDNANVNLYGADVHAKPMDNVSGSAYIYGRNTVNSGGGTVGNVANDNLYVAGLKGKLTAGPAWVKAEFAKDFGQLHNTPAAGTGVPTVNGNYTGWAGKLDLGVKVDLSNLGAIAGWAEGGIGSGGATANRNFQAIAGDYRPGSIWGRFSSNAVGATLGTGLTTQPGQTLSDLVVIGAGVKVTPAALSKLTAGLSWWNFRAQNETSVHVANAIDTKGNKNYGNEYDLDLTWAHSENVTISAGVGAFQPGRLTNTVNGPATNPVRLGYTDLSVKF